MLLKKSLHLVSIIRGIFCVQYFAGSLANPKIMAGRDNRNASGMSPFEQYTQNTQGMGSDNYTFMSPALTPRNGASILPTILNPSAAYRAFAEPSPRSLLSILLER
jgi:hypothetical protein